MMDLGKYCDIKFCAGISVIKMLQFLLDDVNEKGLED